jgi:hypothetical protein
MVPTGLESAYNKRVEGFRDEEYPMLKGVLRGLILLKNTMNEQVFIS